MGSRRIRARSAKSARNKAKGKNTIVTKVNYLKGTRRKGQGTYRVHTKRKK